MISQPCTPQNIARGTWKTTHSLFGQFLIGLTEFLTITLPILLFTFEDLGRPHPPPLLKQGEAQRVCTNEGWGQKRSKRLFGYTYFSLKSLTFLTWKEELCCQTIPGYDGCNLDTSIYSAGTQNPFFFQKWNFKPKKSLRMFLPSLQQHSSLFTEKLATKMLKNYP